MDPLGKENCHHPYSSVTKWKAEVNVMDNQPKGLGDQFRDAIHTKHSTCRTGQTYLEWGRRFILSHEKRYPIEKRSR
jgi:hypothetical protein